MSSTALSFRPEGLVNSRSMTSNPEAIKRSEQEKLVCENKCCEKVTVCHGIVR